MVYDARQVANFLLDLAENRGRPLTTLALLKLIYYAQGWYLAEKNKPLVKNRFEAWKLGPVVTIVYQQFRCNEDKPIKNRAYYFDPVARTKTITTYNFPEDIESFLTATFEEYARYHAFELSDLSHAPGGPWDKVWNAATYLVNPGMVISNDDIKQYFMRISSTSVTH